MAFVRVLTLLMKHPQLGKRVVPIIPDEARTFGMESLFRQFGIYASQGQLYKPHDAEMFLYYKESKDGQILEEGITEAGSMASFTAAGTAYVNYGVEMIPFFIYYSMFGFQRVGDLVWAFGDARGKGFLCGGTAGRTTLAGEGLQHQDGHSLVLASTVPTCAAYDPAYAYEIAIIVQDGIRRMYQEQEDRFYYLTLYNENYPMPPMPEGLDPGGRAARASTASGPAEEGKAVVQLFGSGPILNEALRAQQILAESTAWRRTCGASPATTNCGARRWRWSAGTACIPDQPARTPYIVEALAGRRRADRGGHRLHEGGGRPGRAVAAGPHGDAGHRRLRPQRQPRIPAPAFRGQRRIHRRRGAFAPGARRQVRRRQGQGGLRRAGRRYREDRLPRGPEAAPGGCMQTGQRVAAAGWRSAARWPLVKIFAGLAGHSTAVVADGLESAGDVFSSGFVLLGLTLAAKPADENHPYGHGRVEILTGLLIGLVLTAGGALISYGSVRAAGPAASSRWRCSWSGRWWLRWSPRAGLAVFKFRYGRKLRSAALTADAWNDAMDSLSAVTALIAVGLALLDPARVSSTPTATADSWWG